ncbi:hypothetical protein Cni_G10935 [Canna indica]|uniref:Uncharacterized protein n=1 Tax=Canna indica TaxID=4628 RepID=A0AAQ3KAU0_9LILI|nr:hypothetical protein Cni_G10935 [Canna indica]
MAAEAEKMPGGWPFGLQSLTFRLWRATATAPSFRHIHSDSFSSSSSSDLDTESTRSFFQDHSRTLGSLIGMTPVDRNVETECTTLMSLPHDSMETDEGMSSTCCICVPLMEHVLPGRTSTSRY